MTRRQATGLAVLLALAFLIDAAMIWAGLTLGFDDRMLRIARKTDPAHGFGGGPALLHAVLLVTDLGGAWARTALTTLALVVSIVAKRAREGMLLALTVISGVIVMTGVKEVFHRARPDAAWWLTDVLHPSFPSGHAMGAMILYPLLGLAIGRVLGRARTWTAIGVALALLIGATRVLLGVHWASDVIGGWLIGGAWAFAAYALESTIRAAAPPSP